MSVIPNNNTRFSQPVLHDQPVLPEQLVTRVWQALTRATKDKHHQWRTPVLASIGLDGQPQARTIVLRQADPTAWRLEAYTDSRSPKCLELTQQQHAQLVFWSEKLRWQLRVSVIAHVHTQGELVDHAWAKMRQSPSATDYLTAQAPGSELLTGQHNTAIATHSDRDHHLAVLAFEIIAMDWLALGRGGHLRAHIDRTGTLTPLTP